MKKFTLPPYVARYGLYYLILAGGVFYFKNQMSRQSQLQGAFAETPRLLLPVVHEQNRKLLTQIDGNTTAFLNDHNTKYGSRALVVQQLLQNFQTPNDLAGNVQEAPDIFAVFQQQARSLLEFADSLLLLCDRDPEVEFRLSPLISLAEKLNRFSQNQWLPHVPFTQLTEPIQFHIALAANAALRYLDYRTSGPICFGDMAEPFLAAKQLWPQASEPFEADIFLHYYQPTPPSLEILVNAESWPLQEGMIKYRDTLRSHGNQRLNVRITEFDSARSRLYELESDFELPPLK